MSFRKLGAPTSAFIVARGLSAFSLGVVTVLLNFYFRAVGFDEAFMGKSLALFGFGCGLASVTAGFISDSLGCLNSMIFGELLLCFALWSQVNLENPSLILAASFLAGIGTSFIAVARQPYTASVAKKSQKNSLFSYSYAVFILMMVAGNILGGLVKNIFPKASVASSHRHLLMIAGLINIASAVVLFVSGKLSSKEPCDEEEMLDDGTKNISAFPIVEATQASQWALMSKFGFIRLLIGFGSGLSIPFLNIYLKDRFALSTFSISIIFGIGGLATAAIVMAGPTLSKKGGRVKVITSFQLLSLPFLVILAYTKTLGLAVIAFVTRGACMKMATPIFKSVVMEQIPKPFRGRAASVTETMWRLGNSAGACIGGMVISESGFHTPFILTAVIYFFAAAMFYRLFRDIQDT